MFEENTRKNLHNASQRETLIFGGFINLQVIKKKRLDCN